MLLTAGAHVTIVPGLYSSILGSDILSGLPLPAQSSAHLSLSVSFPFFQVRRCSPLLHNTSRQVLGGTTTLSRSTFVFNFYCKRPTHPSILWCYCPSTPPFPTPVHEPHNRSTTVRCSRPLPGTSSKPLGQPAYDPWSRIRATTVDVDRLFSFDLSTSLPSPRDFFHLARSSVSPSASIPA